MAGRSGLRRRLGHGPPIKPGVTRKIFQAYAYVLPDIAVRPVIPLLSIRETRGAGFYPLMDKSEDTPILNGQKPARVKYAGAHRTERSGSLGRLERSPRTPVTKPGRRSKAHALPTGRPVYSIRVRGSEIDTQPALAAAISSPAVPDHSRRDLPPHTQRPGGS